MLGTSGSKTYLDHALASLAPTHLLLVLTVFLLTKDGSVRPFTSRPIHRYAPFSLTSIHGHMTRAMAGGNTLDKAPSGPVFRLCEEPWRTHCHHKSERSPIFNQFACVGRLEDERTGQCMVGAAVLAIGLYRNAHPSRRPIIGFATPT